MREVTAATGIINTVVQSYDVTYPIEGLAVDANGNLVADDGANILEVTLLGAAAQSAVAPSGSLAVPAGIRFKALAVPVAVHNVVISLH